MLEIGENLFHFVAELHNVAPLVHLDREYDTLPSVVLDILSGIGIFAFDGSDVAQTDDITFRIGVDNAVSHIILRIHLRAQVNGTSDGSIVNGSTDERHSLCRKACQECSRVDTIMRKPVAIDVNTYLFALFTTDSEIRQFGNRAQLIFQLRHIVVQFAIGFILAFQRNQHCRGIAEVVIGHQSQNSLRQRSLQLLQLDFEFAPEVVLVGHIVIQLHKDINDAIFGLRASFLLANLLKTPEERFQRLGHLFLDLGRRSPRIHRHHDALTHRK